MGANKRIAIKWVRDKAKSAYDKKEFCYICGAKENLELHHTNSLTNLFEKWAKDNGLPIDTDEQVIAIRDEFIDKFHDEIYVHVYTLCATHHVKLHATFTKSPPLSTSLKQVKWVEIQKEKHENKLESSKLGNVSKSEPSSTRYSESGGVFGKLVIQHDYFTGFRKD